MTDDDIARLRGLAQAATPGPWEAAETPSGKGKVLCGGVFSVCNTTAGPYKQQRADAAYIAAASPDVLLRLLDALDEARRERDEQKRVIDDAYAALGPDAWWMDPPDGGSPTLAEMVAKANEDGRALYSVKRERDAAMALLKKHGIDYEP